MGATMQFHPYNPALTQHVVANAIYFKAAWQNTFDEDNTIHRKFHVLDGSTVKDLPFMRRRWRFYQQIACHDAMGSGY